MCVFWLVDICSISRIVLFSTSAYIECIDAQKKDDLWKKFECPVDLTNVFDNENRWFQYSF